MQQIYLWFVVLILRLYDEKCILRINSQGGPGETTAEQRRAAETVIMNFRKTKSPYQLCRVIILFQ